MKYVLNSKQMKDCDLSVINGDISKSLELIDRASSACVKHLYSDGFDLTKALIVCGRGNNGADGMAIAGKLIADNHEAVVLICDDKKIFSKEASLLAEKIDMITLDEFKRKYRADEFTCIVDAIFGIGLSRDVEGKYLEIIEMINESGVKVLSVDIPSGISSDNGRIMKGAVKAYVTVTFACLKAGQLLYPGKLHCGKLYVEDIGVPLIDAELKNYCVTDIFDDGNYLPKRVQWGNKGTFGKVLIVAGSSEIFGAAYLAAMAAYKSGCGMVHILTERSNVYSLQQMIPEALLHFYDEKNTQEAVDMLEVLLDGCDCICAGSGLGQSNTAIALVKGIIESDKKMVLDADALNIISKEGLLGKINKGNCILTPHVMEMSRLCGLSCDNIKENFISCALKFSNENNVILVLKDAVTVVASKNECTYINRTGNCSMAKAGSGDVLAGIITGLLAQEGKLLNAAQLGVYIHGLIGDRALKNTGEYSLMARNLLDGIEELTGYGD